MRVLTRMSVCEGSVRICGGEYIVVICGCVCKAWRECVCACSVCKCQVRVLTRVFTCGCVYGSVRVCACSGCVGAWACASVTAPTTNLLPLHLLHRLARRLRILFVCHLIF